MVDKIKIVFAALLVIAGIAAFYYFSEKAMIVRVAAVLGGMVAAGLLFLTAEIGRQFKTYTVEYPELVKLLRDNHVAINAKPPDDSPWYVTLLVTWGPFVLFLALWFFLMRQMQIGGNKALSFGRSRARMLTEDRKKITFSDVAGIDEAKEEVVEIIEFLKDPHKFQKLGGRIPKGVLIVGPPGTGKTLLAKAISGEAGVPFSASAARISWRCSSAWAPLACAICSSKARSTRLASSSLMRSTPSDGSEGRVWEAATMSGSRR